MPIIRRFAQIDCRPNAEIALTLHGDTVVVTGLLPRGDNAREHPITLLHYELVSGVARRDQADQADQAQEDPSDFSVSLF